MNSLILTSLTPPPAGESEPKKPSPFTVFPEELLTKQIFPHLSPQDLLNCRLVGKQFKRVASGNDQWKTLVQKQWPHLYQRHEKNQSPDWLKIGTYQLNLTKRIQDNVYRKTSLKQNGKPVRPGECAYGGEDHLFFHHYHSNRSIRSIPTSTSAIKTHAEIDFLVADMTQNGDNLFILDHKPQLSIWSLTQKNFTLQKDIPTGASKVWSAGDYAAVYYAGTNPKVRLYNKTSGNELLLSNKEEATPTSLHEKDSLFYYGYSDGKIWFNNDLSETKKQLFVDTKKKLDFFWIVGRYLITKHPKSSIIWDFDTKKKILNIAATKYTVTSVTKTDLGPNTLLITTKKKAILWNAKTKETLFKYPHHNPNGTISAHYASNRLTVNDHKDGFTLIDFTKDPEPEKKRSLTQTIAFVTKKAFSTLKACFNF